MNLGAPGDLVNSSIPEPRSGIREMAPPGPIALSRTIVDFLPHSAGNLAASTSIAGNFAPCVSILPKFGLKSGDLVGDNVSLM